MRKSIMKLLWAQNRKSAIILSSISLFIGFLIVIFSVSLFYRIQQTVKSDVELFSSDFVVINKQVSLLNTISFVKSEFTEKEIAELEDQSFVTNIAPFISNQFKIGAYTEPTADIPGFYTELFFQSIPDKYLNVKDKRWKWERGQREIPIIFPGDYLKLYNFGFATSQGLPQVSAETISKVPLKVKITGKHGEEEFMARIIGLTDKVNSILVPLDFMNWANDEFGNSVNKENPSMILIETPNSSDPSLFSFLQDHGYETNMERIKNSKTSLFLKILFTVVGIIGLIIILLSLLLFSLSFEILILRSAKEIEKLYLLGYHSSNLLPSYLLVIGFILLIINGLSLFANFYLMNYIHIVFSNNGFSMSSIFSGESFITAGAITAFIFIFNMISINSHLRRIK